MDNQEQEKDLNKDQVYSSQEELENTDITQNPEETPAEPINHAEEVNPINALENLEKEVADQKDKYLRLYADFENFRRRTAKEKIEFTEQANTKLILEILPIVDDFERALKSVNNNSQAPLETLKQGVELIHGKLSKLLEKQSVKEIVTNPGDEFDVEKHEAISQIPAPSEELRGKIIDSVEKGYMIGEKVIRFAKVIIGS